MFLAWRGEGFELPNPEGISRQYRVASEIGGFLRRSDRGLIEVTGKDRAAWLHNLVTNTVKTVLPGDGNYAFATNVKGRTVFDLNILVLEDRLLLDVDRQQFAGALRHLDRYIISEDVKLKDRGDDVGRFAIVGPQSLRLVDRMGGTNLAAMAQLQHRVVPMGGAEIRVVRHDFAGLTGAELLVEQSHAQPVFEGLKQAALESGFVELEPATIEILRVEAGIPASIVDIDDEVVPPETGQVERGISYHKGCYLGQEVIERMRSHGILAKRLVGLAIEGECLPAKGSQVSADGQEVGRTTSSCWSEALKGVLCLGFVKTAFSSPETRLEVANGGERRPGQVVKLPVRGSN